MDRKNKTRKINQKKLNNANMLIAQLYGLENEKGNNTLLNNIQVPEYFKLITDKHTYNVRIEYDITDDIISIIQTNNSIVECVILSIIHDDEVADLLTVNYHSKCSKNFQRGTGTVHMIKTILRYVLDKYPHVKSFNIKDATNINEGIDKSVKIPFFVTTRRLIQGQPGWYEEKFGAKPTGDSIEILDFLRNKRNLFDKMIPYHEPNTWWTEENTLELLKKIQIETDQIDISLLQTMIFFTDWTIPAENIEYIEYKLIKVVSGGDRINTIMNKTKSMRMPLRRITMNIPE